MKRKMKLFLCLFPFALSLFAQMDSAPAGRGGPGGRGGGFRSGSRFGGEGGPGMMMRDTRGDAEAELAAKYPEEFAKLVQARAEAEKGMQELAAKAGVTLPMADFTRRAKMAEFNKKYEAELKEIGELRKTDPRGAMKKYFELLEKEGLSFGRPGAGRMGPGFGGGREPGSEGPAAPVRMGPREKMEQMVKAGLPEEYKEYEELRKSDPASADQKLRELARKLREQKGK